MDAPPARPRRANYYLRKFAVMLMSQRCATSRKAHGRNRSESCWIRSAETVRCGGIDATLALPCAAGSVISSRGAGDRGAAARRLAGRISLERGFGSHAKIMSGRADDVAVVPADAYEYRHLLEVAQP